MGYKSWQSGPLCAVGRGEQIAVFVCDGCVIWISKCALQIELRCGRVVWNLLVIVVFESGLSLANKLQLDSSRGKAIVKRIRRESEVERDRAKERYSNWISGWIFYNYDLRVTRL